MASTSCGVGSPADPPPGAPVTWPRSIGVGAPAPMPAFPAPVPRDSSGVGTGSPPAPAAPVMDAPAEPVFSWSSGNGTGPLARPAASATEASPPRAGTGRDHGPEEDESQPRRRRLQRVREGQQLAGVCNGLADYAELDVAWVRTGFVLGSLVTGGILVLVYIALAFILPVAPRRTVRS